MLDMKRLRWTKKKNKTNQISIRIYNVEITTVFPEESVYSFVQYQAVSSHEQITNKIIH